MPRSLAMRISESTRSLGIRLWITQRLTACGLMPKALPILVGPPNVLTISLVFIKQMILKIDFQVKLLQKWLTLIKLDCKL